MLHTTQGARESGAHAGEQAGERVYAALDLGTNNCRLLIAAPQERASDVCTPSAAHTLKVYDSFSRIVRLGEGVSQSGRLSDEAMERTMLALKACQKKLAKYNIAKSRFVATEACRRAANGEAFIKRVLEETGLAIDIISTEEEAHLAFMGCSSLLTQSSSRAVVFDIGGGSTELMWIDVENNKRITDWLSISYGVMNLADKFGGSNFADMAFDDMVRVLTERIRPFDSKNNISKIMGGGKVQMLSTSGTVTTLAAVHLNLPRYDRARIDGITLKVSDIRSATHKLLAMRPSERFNHPCVGPDRADFILSGSAIFEAIGSLWPEGDITIADRGVREGIILSLMEKHA